MVTEVKICGLMRPEDAATAASCGADYLGVIFAESQRRVAADRACLILDAALPSTARRVGVFGSSGVDEILQIAALAHLDVLQLLGEISPTAVSRLRHDFGGQLWGVIRVPPEGIDAADWARWEEVDAVVVDTWSGGAPGGTGLQFDWASAATVIGALRGSRPVVLAGGLTPDNVVAGMATLAPNVVDVSSGVEVVRGQKDPVRIAAFVRAVKGKHP